MTGPADLDVLRALISEAEAEDFTSSGSFESEARTARALLWLTSALLTGGWVDLEDGVSDQTMYETARSFLDALPCRSLLQPWLESREWPADEITALKVAHKLEPERG